MEVSQIIQAVTWQWRNSTALLQAIPIRSTRIPQGVAVTVPYCLVEAALMKRRFCSGSYCLAEYRVTLTVFCPDKSVLDAIGTAIAGLFGLNIGLPVADNCYVLSVVPVAENPETDPDDYYGSDVSTLRQSFLIQLNETTPAVRAALAT